MAPRARLGAASLPASHAVVKHKTSAWCRVLFACLSPSPSVVLHSRHKSPSTNCFLHYDRLDFLLDQILTSRTWDLALTPWRLSSAAALTLGLQFRLATSLNTCHVSPSLSEKPSYIHPNPWRTCPNAAMTSRCRPLAVTRSS